MCRPNFYILICIFFFGLTALSQDTTKYVLKNYFTVKAGASYNYLYQTYYYNSNSYITSTGNNLIVGDWAYYFPQKTAIAPYVCVGFTSKESNHFEYFLGLSFSQFSRNFSFFKYQYTYDSLSLKYSKIEVSGEGTFKNNLFKLEFSPSYYIKRTKFNFGVFNMDVILPMQSNKQYTRNYYDVIPNSKKYSSISGLDSIKTLVFSEQISYTKNAIKPLINISFSFGVEQEIPYRKQLFLLGIKASYNALIVSTPHFNVLVYTGLLLHK